MKVLINAASVKEGGSKVVLTRLLAAMCAAAPDVSWIVAAHPLSIPAAFEFPKVHWLAVPLGSSVADTVRWYEVELPRLVERHRIDVLFSQTNYLPRRALACPTLLLVQHAGHFSPVFDRLTVAQLRSPVHRFLWRRKRGWVRRSVRAASLLTVQTEALARSVAVVAGRAAETIAVVPHGPGLVSHRRGKSTPLRPRDVFTVGYVSKWGVHKDFDTLFLAAEMLQASGQRFRLMLTLHDGEPAAASALARARAAGIMQVIENQGEVADGNVEALYDGLDAFVFPSLCESFGFPIVEAMARGLPMVVAATPENLEVTRGCALAFPAGDAATLAHYLERLIDDERTRTERAALSLAAGRHYSWERAARETLAALRRAAGAPVR